MPSLKAPQLSDFTKAFAAFQTPAFSVDQFATAQRRNLEAATAAAQLTTESVQTALTRQWEFFGQFVAEGSAGFQQLWSPGTPDQKLAQQAAFAKSTFEKTLGNAREFVDLFVKSGTEIGDVLAKRVTETLTELEAAPAKV